MARSSIKLEGFKELEAKLAELPSNIGRAAARRGMKKASEGMADAMRQLAPRDDGDLIESIGIAVKSKNRAGLAEFSSVLRGGGSKDEAVAALRTARRTGASIETGTRITVNVGPSAPHSKLVEFGTKPRYQKSGKYVGIGPAQPFVRPAFDREKVAAVEAIKREITVEIGKSTARLEKRAAKLALAGG